MAEHIVSRVLPPPYPAVLINCAQRYPSYGVTRSRLFPSFKRLIGGFFHAFFHDLFAGLHLSLRHFPHRIGANHYTSGSRSCSGDVPMEWRYAHCPTDWGYWRVGEAVCRKQIARSRVRGWWGRYRAEHTITADWSTRWNAPGSRATRAHGRRSAKRPLPQWNRSRSAAHRSVGTNDSAE